MGNYIALYTEITPALKYTILSKYENVSGIYLWYNTITHRYYVGKSVNLKTR